MSSMTAVSASRSGSSVAIGGSCHEGAHLLTGGAHPGQRVDRAAAVGEDVDRTGAQRVNDPVQVRGVLVRGELAVAVAAPAAAGARGS